MYTVCIRTVIQQKVTKCCVHNVLVRHDTENFPLFHTLFLCPWMLFLKGKSCLVGCIVYSSTFAYDILPVPLIIFIFSHFTALCCWPWPIHNYHMHVYIPLCVRCLFIFPQAKKRTKITQIILFKSLYTPGS